MTEVSDYIHEKGVIYDTKGHKFLKQVSIEDGVAEILAEAQKNKDWTTTIGGLIAGMSTKERVVADDGEYILTKQGFMQLVKERMGLPPAIFADKRISFATQLKLLEEAASGESGQKEIIVRASKKETGQMVIDGIVTPVYSFFDNSTLAMTILNLRNQEALPESAQFMTLGIAPRAVDLRIVSDDWDFQIGENGHAQPYKGNLVINNSEIGKGSLGVRVAVTRWECLNSTIGSSVVEINHKYAEYQEFMGAIRQGLQHIRGYSEEMIDHLSNFRQIEVPSPMLIFAKVGEKLGVPKYAMQGVKDYWEQNGSGDTLYDTVQALTWGVQEVTHLTGKRVPNWGQRAELEREIWDTALMLQNLHTEGLGIDHYLICDKCHQTLPEVS